MDKTKYIYTAKNNGHIKPQNSTKMLNFGSLYTKSVHARISYLHILNLDKAAAGTPKGPYQFVHILGFTDISEHT